MNFDCDFDHPPAASSLSPREFWAYCQAMMRRNPRLRPETCMEIEDDERWMEAPFTLAVPEDKQE